MSHPSAVFARELVATLADRGVREFILCPGSRSGPLAHALAEAGGDNLPLGAPSVDLHVRIDERAAAFLALGAARGAAATGTARPVAIVTTSGTAVGNLLPAVMEAHHSGIPLLVLTADRPGELRGVGANQTTDQSGIFGPFARWSANVAAPADGDEPGRAGRLAARAVSVALGDPARDDMTGTPGPVHLNLEFRDPLGADNGVWDDAPRIDEPTSTDSSGVPVVGDPAPLPDVERTVVIAGDDAGDDARLVAEAHGWPLLAEPTSGARAGDACIARYVDLLDSDAGRDLARQIHQVVLVGRPTLTRTVQRLIADAPALMVAGHGARWREAPRHAERVVRAVPASWWHRADGAFGLNSSPWLAQWRDAASRLDASPAAWDRRAVASAFLDALPPRALALVGSSGAVRAVDQVAPAYAPGEAPILIANRGLAGIDGTVSTTIGMGLVAGAPVTALMGDVTFVHDIGGLMVGPRERRPRVRIVVINDGGGTIFSSLEHASAAPATVERVFTTPHGVDVGHACAAFGVAHTRVTNADTLARALASPPSGLEVVEAVLR